MTSSKSTWSDGENARLGFLEIKVLDGNASPEEITEYRELASRHSVWMCSQPWFCICANPRPHPPHKFMIYDCQGVAEYE